MHFHGHPSIHRRATHCFSSVFDRYSMPPSGPNSAPGSYCKPMRPPHIKMYTLRCTFRWSHVFTLLTAPEYIKTRRRSLRTPPRPDVGCYHDVADVVRLQPKCSRSYEENGYVLLVLYQSVRWNWRMRMQWKLSILLAVIRFLQGQRSSFSNLIPRC